MDNPSFESQENGKQSLPIDVKNDGIQSKKTSGEPNTDDYKMTKFQIIKNLLVVSFGFLCLFTSFSSLQNLQSSLHDIDGLGTVGLSCIYAALVVSCLFVPAPFIDYLGCKWSIAFSMLCYVLFMAANMYAQWWTIIPSALILGIGAAPLWSAKCTYLTQTGTWYSRMTGTTEDDVINRFFGVFFMFFQTSNIIGNLISSLVFSEGVDKSGLNKTKEELEKCGANFDPTAKEGNDTSSSNDEKPDMTKVYIVCGIYIGCALLAFALIAFLLDKIYLDKDDKKAKKRGFSFKLVLETAKHVYNSLFQKLLIPLTIYSGIEQAFIAGDFTQSFITCSIGIWNVGFIMICYGVVDSLCSFTFGRLVQYVGHIPFFILAFVVHMSALITFLLWTPDPDNVIIYYILAALWGIGDAVVQTQINALYGWLFIDKPEAAFANYRLWESIGFIVAFGYSAFIRTVFKIYICMGVLVLGMALYAVVEFLQRRKGNSFDISPK